MRKVLNRFSALVGCGLLCATQAWAGVIDTAKVENRLEDIMQRPGMVGLSIAIVENGEITYVKGFGETIKGSGEKVTPDTVFRWASVSKSVAAATVLELSEDGYFDLDTPAVLEAPSLNFPRSRKPVTIHDILSQQTGLVRNSYDRKIEAGQRAKPLRERLNRVYKICEPGTCYSYQNVAYDATAEIAESATGLPYKSIVNERIFEPLSMDTATTTLQGLTRSKSWARPHFRSGKTINRVLPTYYRIPGAAGVNSSITDLAKWMTAHMDEESGALPASVAEDMRVPRVETASEERYMRRRFDDKNANAHYGYGWRIYDYKGRRLVGHRGAVQGYRALVLFDPEIDSGIAMLWNSGHSYPVELQMEVMEMAYNTKPVDWTASLDALDDIDSDHSGSP